MKELLTRIAVALVGIPLLVFLIIEGDWYFFALAVIISIAGQIELYNIAAQKDTVPQKISGIVLAFLTLLIVQIDANRYVLALLFATIVLVFSREMFKNKGSAFLNTAVTLMGVVYPGLFVGCLLFLRNNIDSIGIGSAAGFILTLFVAIWACDTFAYFVGKSIGKHRLFERVSPKKSIEGAVGGLFGAILVFAAVHYFNWYQLSLDLAIISGLIVGTFGQLGDLVESWFKRDAAVKDSSHILPGHGGFLDRFDSLMFVAPVFVVLYLLWS